MKKMQRYWSILNVLEFLFFITFSFLLFSSFFEGIEYNPILYNIYLIITLVLSITSIKGGKEYYMCSKIYQEIDSILDKEDYSKEELLEAFKLLEYSFRFSIKLRKHSWKIENLEYMLEIMNKFLATDIDQDMMSVIKRNTKSIEDVLK